MERSIEPSQHSAEASGHARDVFHASATPIVLASPSAKVRVTASARPGICRAMITVDLMVIRALDDGIHRDGHTTARAKHATKLGEASHRIGEDHQPEIAQHCVETGIRERKRLPILHRD